jgi:hypothetical protein
MVDVDAIERLHNYYDSELDCEEWTGIDGDGDDDHNLTMEIRKSQYDYMVESIHTLKQRFVYAERHADKLKEQNDELKEQIQTIYQSLMENTYADTWFNTMDKNGRIDAYERGRELGWYELPFYSADIEVMQAVGLSKAVMCEFAHKKYEEWKNERVQMESDTETE